MLLRKQVYKGRLSISDLDDAEQEAVCRLWIALIDGKFADILLDPHCQGAFDKLRFWLFGTVRNVVREFGRRRCWERALTNALVEDRAFRTAADTSNFAEARELLNLCGSSDASIIRLMLTDHTVSEAAQMLYINPSTVYRRLRALQTLAEKVFNSRQLRNFD
jgi:DNA-directed RNA polymerase specialized sigma24 family protein